jgi:hypothetical protein
MSKHNEWQVGRGKAREGIDTRYQGRIGAPNAKGSFGVSNVEETEEKGRITFVHVPQYRLDRSNAYWDQIRAQKEAEEAEKERQRQIEYQRSIRNTEANFPSLVHRSVVVESMERETLSYQSGKVRVAPQEQKRERKVGYIVPPVEIRVRKSRISMLDERPEYLRVAEPEEDLDAKYLGIAKIGDMYEEQAEWEEFEMNEELGDVGEEFDI